MWYGPDRPVPSIAFRTHSVRSSTKMKSRRVSITKTLLSLVSREKNVGSGPEMLRGP